MNMEKERIKEMQKIEKEARNKNRGFNELNINMLTESGTDKAKIELIKLNNKNFEYFNRLINRKSKEIDIINYNLENINNEPIVFNNLDKAKNYLLNIDLRILFNLEKIELKEKVHTSLFKDVETYFNKIKSGFKLFVYCNGIKKAKENKPKCLKSKTEKAEYDNFHKSINIINLYMLINNTNYTTAIKELCEIFNIKIEGRLGKLMKNEMIKHSTNVLSIRKDVKKYKNLNALIGKYLFLLEHISYLSLETTTDSLKQYKNSNIFYATTRSIEKSLCDLETLMNIKITYKSKSRIQKVLALFRTLKLIEEIEIDYIEDNVKVINTKKTDVHFYPKKYYITNTLNSKTLRRADKIAEKLLESDFVLSNFTYKNTETAFGEEYAKKIFCDVYKTQININNHKLYTLKNLAETEIDENNEDDSMTEIPF